MLSVFPHHLLPIFPVVTLGLVQIDSTLRFWLDPGATDGSSCGHCNHCTSHSADTLSKLESPVEAVMNSVRIEQKSMRCPGGRDQHRAFSHCRRYRETMFTNKQGVPTVCRICPGNTGDWDRTVDLHSISHYTLPTRVIRVVFRN